MTFYLFLRHCTDPRDSACVNELNVYQATQNFFRIPNSMTKQAAGKNLNYVWRFFGQTQRETNGKQLIFQGRENFITCVSALSA